jgi:hypothetical protein
MKTNHGQIKLTILTCEMRCLRNDNDSIGEKVGVLTMYTIHIKATNEMVWTPCTITS